MLSVLVTGGAGFIGSHLVDSLIRDECDITILDNLSTSSLPSVKETVLGERVTFVQGDVRDYETVRECVKGKDAIVHLAALTNISDSLENAQETFDVNTRGTFNLLKAGAQSKVKRVVFTSSCAVYGEPSMVPTREDHPLQPASPYASSKVSAEELCKRFHLDLGVDIVTLRLFNVYGPGQNHGAVVREFGQKAIRNEAPVIFGDGEQTRDFIFVSDVVKAISTALHSDVGTALYNLGSGHRICINQLLRQIATIRNATPRNPIYMPARKGDVTQSHADITRIREDLNFSPSIDLETGLQLTLDSLTIDRVV